MLRRSCTLCGAAVCDKLELCTACHATLPTLGPCCPRCSLPSAFGIVCGRCQVASPPFSRCIAVFRYDYPIDALLKAAKFSGRLRYLEVLGRLMATVIEARREPRPECLIPVPLHPFRMVQRGYNQAVELARPVSDRLRIPLVTDACVRVRRTTPQTLLPAALRRRQLAHAFSVPRELPFRHVAVLDDVVTTGGTARTLSLALLAKGVREVEVWTVARTV